MTTLSHSLFFANSLKSHSNNDALSKAIMLMSLCLFSMSALAVEKIASKESRKSAQMTVATNKPKSANLDDISELISSSQLTNLQVTSQQEPLNQELSPEARAKLQRELYEYNSMVDPGHIQIEERRKVLYKRLVERFEQCDPDNDGTMSPIEAAEFMPQIARHFNVVDTNNDNLISLDELVVAQNKAEERRMASRYDGNKIEAKLDNTGDSEVIKRKSRQYGIKKHQL